MSNSTVNGLRAIAKGLGMPGYSNLNKIDLINAIEQIQGAIAQVEVANKDARADPEPHPFTANPQVANEAVILDAIPDGVAPPTHHPPTNRADWYVFIHTCHWPVCAAIALALYAGRVTARAWGSRPAHVNRWWPPKWLYS